MKVIGHDDVSTYSDLIVKSFYEKSDERVMDRVAIEDISAAKGTGSNEIDGTISKYPLQTFWLRHAKQGAFRSTVPLPRNPVQNAAQGAGDGDFNQGMLVGVAFFRQLAHFVCGELRCAFDRFLGRHLPAKFLFREF